MAKKQINKQTENAIRRNAPAEAKWLTQPINITFMKGDMTLNQVNTMIELVDALQEQIGYALTNKVKSVFKDEDYDAMGKLVVPVAFSSMTSDARRYQYYEDVARSLAETSVTIEKIGDDGTPYTSIKPIISEARVPKSDSGYRSGTIEFVIEKEMVDTLFDINRYNRYIKSVAKNSKSVYTSRIYQFITAYKNIGTWKPKYEELHVIFGLSTYVTDKVTKLKTWVPKKYPNYRQFKQKILKVAHDELKELADRGEVDCYFEFSEEYPTAKHMGKPERIVFNIISTSFGIDHDKSVAVSRQKIEIEKMLREFGCSVSDMKQILKLVTADNAKYCIEQITNIKAYICTHKDKVGNVKAYAVSSIKNALIELVPQADEVKVSPLSVQEMKPKTAKTSAEPTDADRTEWGRVVESLNGSAIIDALELKADNDGAYIKVPSHLSFDVFKKEIDIIMSAGYRVKKG